MSIDLQKSVISHFWSGRDVRLSKILYWMETMETWMLDEDENISYALKEMVDIMDDTTPDKIRANAGSLLSVLAYVSFPRALRIIHWLDERYSNSSGEKKSNSKGLIADLTHYAQNNMDDERIALFIERLQTLKSLSLLGKVFSPYRTRVLSELLRRDTEDVLR